ncbi:Translational activator GCN1 [Hordeum vulgare]|nr:Translational activator GCN1 [Hordeum vulgare]
MIGTDEQDMTTQTQDLSQVIVLSDNQFPPSFVQDSHPMYQMAPDLEVFASDYIYVPGKWYDVFIGKAPEVYSSWEEASAQVAPYSNSSHRGFKTRQAAEQAYSDWVRKHGGSSADSGKVGGVKVKGATADRHLGLKLKNFIIFVQFIDVAVLWR